MESRHDYICRKAIAIVSRGDKPTVSEARWLKDLWYRIPGNEVGGELHVILDDGNLERKFLVGVIMDSGACDAAKWICNVLLRMTPSQKRRLYAGR
jgi:hypothetical protein